MSTEATSKSKVQGEEMNRELVWGGGVDKNERKQCASDVSRVKNKLLLCIVISSLKEF